MKLEPDVSLLMSLQEVADSLRISAHTVRAFVRSGRLTPVRICRRLLFDRAAIRELIQRAKVDAK